MLFILSAHRQVKNKMVFFYLKLVFYSLVKIRKCLGYLFYYRLACCNLNALDQRLGPSFCCYFHLSSVYCVHEWSQFVWHDMRLQ